MNTAATKIIACTVLALLAFAGNSILCRLALGGGTIDAASFTNVRLVSGMVVLALILGVGRSTGTPVSKGGWRAAFMLFLYAVAFSYAYLSLETGVGALILFGSVQITMILAGIAGGHRLHPSELAGVVIAFAGLVYLVMPGLAAPSLSGFVLMTVAGIAWAGYTLAGRGSTHPLGDTAYNFLRTLPFVAVLFALTFRHASLTGEGVLLAALSGGVTSGLGYTIWYIALGGLTATQAAVLQLLVPVIAALGGVVFAGESVTLRLVLSSLMVLGGILAVVMGRRRATKSAAARVAKGR